MLKQLLEKIVTGNDLSLEEMSSLMGLIMDGQLTPAQTAAFLVALRMKGESTDEITAAANIMRQHAALIDAGAENVIDTCGTGGDGAHTFNISTTAAFVAAGAGIAVAKHGNRSVSSQCGSADVLAALGFNLEVEPLVMEECLKEHGICFLFAPRLHPAMKNIAPIRKELRIRTIFNMLGPLTNPAGANGQVIGVFAPVLTETFAGALKALGAKRAFVVHGHDGLDEITCTGPTRITELRDGRISTYDLYPEILLGNLYPAADIKGGGPAENAAVTEAVLHGKNHDGARAIVLLNAAAAIIAGCKADTMEEGLRLAEKSIDSGAALQKLEILIAGSRK